MGKVHITLVGGQPAPVYNGIVATNPDKVIFVCSTESKDIVDRVIKEIDKPSEVITELDPTDPLKISSCALTLAEKYRNDDITLNISGGLKSWSHLFGKVFDQMPNAATVYIDQNNLLWNYSTMQKSGPYNADMHTLFRLYGNSIDNSRDIKSFSSQDEKSAAAIELARKFAPAEFRNLMSVLSDEDAKKLKNERSGRFELPGGSYVIWEKPSANGGYGKVSLHLVRRNSVCQDFRINSPNAVSLAFNSGWLECKTARILSAWKRSEEVLLNCHFPFKPGVDKNEVDVIVNTGTKLLFVECKTQVTHGTDIDKFHSVVKTYGGNAAKGLFITDAKMRELDRTKCDEKNILHFSYQDCINGIFSPKEALVELLEHELFHINT